MSHLAALFVSGRATELMAVSLVTLCHGFGIPIVVTSYSYPFTDIKQGGCFLIYAQADYSCRFFVYSCMTCRCASHLFVKGILKCG